MNARRGGSRIIDPEFLDAELERLNDIQEQVDMIQPTSTIVKINEAMAQVREYGNEASAEVDAAYVKLMEDMSLTIPTDKGESYFTPPTLILECNFYKKGRIIVEYTSMGYLSISEEKEIIDLLESLLGPPFIAGD